MYKREIRCLSGELRKQPTGQFSIRELIVRFSMLFLRRRVAAGFYFYANATGARNKPIKNAPGLSEFFLSKEKAREGENAMVGDIDCTA